MDFDYQSLELQKQKTNFDEKVEILKNILKIRISALKPAKILSLLSTL